MAQLTDYEVYSVGEVMREMKTFQRKHIALAFKNLQSTDLFRTYCRSRRLRYPPCPTDSDKVWSDRRFKKFKIPVIEKLGRAAVILKLIERYDIGCHI